MGIYLKAGFLGPMVDICLTYKKLKGRTFQSNFIYFFDAYLLSSCYVQSKPSVSSPHTHKCQTAHAMSPPGSRLPHISSLGLGPGADVDKALPWSQKGWSESPQCATKE